MIRTLAYIEVVVLVVGLLLSTCGTSVWSMGTMSEDQLARITGTHEQGECDEYVSPAQCPAPPRNEHCPSKLLCTTGNKWDDSNVEYIAAGSGEKWITLSNVLTCNKWDCTGPAWQCYTIGDPSLDWPLEIECHED